MSELHEAASAGAKDRREESTRLSHLALLQQWLRAARLDGIIVPSSDEFLSEFSPPANRRLEWVSGFGGSTGLGVILHDAAALFLDGRYYQQAKVDDAITGFEIEAAGLAAREDWLRGNVSGHAKLGFDPWLHSGLDRAQWQDLGRKLSFELDRLPTNPIDDLWGNARPPEHFPPIVDHPQDIAGESGGAKLARLVAHMKLAGLQGFLLSDPEDVSWLLNVRAAASSIQVNVGEWHIVPSCASRALVLHDGRVLWFVDSARMVGDVVALRAACISIAPPELITSTLSQIASQGPIGADVRRTPAILVNAIEGSGSLCADDFVARARWRKHPAEVAAARRVHRCDAAAVVKFMAWVTGEVPKRAITEFEAAEKMHEFRAASRDYIGHSMPAMSASGPSGAQPHYVPRRHCCRNLNDHSIFWMDSGGQYSGGTTDNTISLALGRPDPKHVLAHTLVLRGFLALAMSRFPAGTPAFRMDSIARQPLWQQGLDYDHGTGHGVGNYLNIHEGPLITREPGPLSSVPLEVGMIVTNEPGYYAAGDFGIRIESHMAVVQADHAGFLEFDTISRLPIDPDLVDFDRLSSVERQWLADYHRRVLNDLESMLDERSAQWLRGIVVKFTRAAEIKSNAVS